MLHVNILNRFDLLWNIDHGKEITVSLSSDNVNTVLVCVDLDFFRNWFKITRQFMLNFGFYNCRVPKMFQMTHQRRSNLNGSKCFAEQFRFSLAHSNELRIQSRGRLTSNLFSLKRICNQLTEIFFFFFFHLNETQIPCLACTTTEHSINFKLGFFIQQSQIWKQRE